MLRPYRLLHRFLPATVRLAWSRSLIERGYGKDIAAARLSKNYKKVSYLESSRRFELDLQDEEEDAHVTKQLLRKARTLRVPIPRSRNEDGTDSDHWYEGSQTGGRYLTDSGIKVLRDEIRQESKARHEARSQLVIWLSALTGVVGAITGLIAVLAQKQG